jgi:membrane protein
VDTEPAHHAAGAQPSGSPGGGSGSGNAGPGISGAGNASTGNSSTANSSPGGDKRRGASRGRGRSGLGGSRRATPGHPGSGRGNVWRGYWSVFAGAVAASITDRMTLAAAGCAFYATLALFPAISMLISVYGLAFNPGAVAAQLQVLQDIVPPPAFALISDRARELGSQPRGSLSTSLAVSLVLTFWSASTGTKSVLSALNVVHDVTEQRGFLRFQLTGLAMTLAAVLVAALAIAVLVFIPAAISYVGLSRYSGGLLHSAAMGLLVGLFGVALAVFYRIGPSRLPPPQQPILPGVVLATILWLAASMLLSWYVSHIASYGVTYGPLGAVVGVMLWFYMSAYAVLLGAELNARLEAIE